MKDNYGKLDWFDELERAANLDAVNRYKTVMGAQWIEPPAPNSSLFSRFLAWVIK